MITVLSLMQTVVCGWDLLSAGNVLSIFVLAKSAVQHYNVLPVHTVT
jgi:hypothetical protein